MVSEGRVVLEKRFDPPGPWSVDTLGKAIEALDELGLCMNWGILIPGKHLTRLVYEGWTSRVSHERYVELPFDPSAYNFADRFSDLLTAIFKPFLEDSTVHRSIINVIPGKDNVTGQECFFVTLVLIFREDGTKKSEIIKTRLRAVEDAEEKIEAIDFCLD